MTTEYIFKNTVEELAKEFPELSAYLPSDRVIVDHFEVPSEKSMMKMIVRMSDRVNVHWEVNGCRLSGVWGFFVGEVIEEIREYLSERKVFLEYEVDLDLARKLNQEIPEGVPTKTMCRSSPYNSMNLPRFDAHS